jgi:cobalt-zinc-cadmium efflux system membrane fusion protein
MKTCSFALGHRRLMVVVSMAAVAACGRHGAETAGDSTDAAVVDATVVPVAVQPFVESVTALGVVQSRSGHVAELSAPAATRVTGVLVALGDVVKQDQPLVTLDLSGFDAAARSANAAVSAARHAQERAARLVNEGIAARKDLEQADAELARAEADSSTAHRLVALGQIRSPIAGVVTRLDATLGASVDLSQVLVEVADPTALDLLLTVTPADAAQIARGDAVAIRATDGPSGATIAAGRVADIGSAVDSASRGVIVRVQVGRAERQLRIGESVTGVITAATRPQALVVPSVALVPQDDGFTVFVVDSANVAHATPVILGGRGDSVVEIVKGLAAGDRVVTHGAFGVEDGTRIGKPKP